MTSQIDFVPPSLYRTILDRISNPTIFYSPSEPLVLGPYYNRGKYKFVYKLDGKVIKVFKICSPLNPYFGYFYKKSKAQIKLDDNHFQPQMSTLERTTMNTSLAIMKLESETYDEARAILPHRCIETDFGILKKSRFGITYYREYSVQPFIDGPTLGSLVTGEVKIRDMPLDGSAESMSGVVLDLGHVDKKEVLSGLEDFLSLVDAFLSEQDAVLELGLRNLAFDKSRGLVTYDLQKFHRRDWNFSPDLSPLDVHYILAGALEVNR